jgi:hypothetical protein
MSLLYARWNDRVASVTPTLETGTINALYPLSRLVNPLGDPALLAKTTSTGDCRVLWSFAGPTRLDGVWLPMYKAAAGTVLRFEGHTSNAWGAPTVSRSKTVPAHRGSGARALPRGLFIDLRTDPGYTTGGLQYWSLFFPNAGIITALGGIFLASQVREVRNFQYGLARPRERASILHSRNDGGWFVYSRGTDKMRLSGTVLAGTSQYDDLLELHDDCDGATYPFPIVLESHLADAEGFVMRWVSGFEARAEFFVHDTVSAEWAMVPRGRAV